MMEQPLHRHNTSSPSIFQHVHDSSGEYTPSMLTPSSDYRQLPPESTPDHTPHHVDFGNGPIYRFPTDAFCPPLPPPPTDFARHQASFIHLKRPAQPGSSVDPSHDAFALEAMKRALDTLPPNPLNGLPPQIDGASTFSNAPPKRARHSPNEFPGSFNGVSVFIPRVPGAYQSSPGLANQPTNALQTMQAPQSPIHLGGPLSTPAQPSLNSPGVPPSPYMGMMGVGFGQYPYMYPSTPIMSPSMNPNTMTGNYGPAAAAAAAAAAGNTTGRTVYVGNLPPEASADELLNLVRFGPIEAVRLLPEKNCVFISFLDGSTAAAFHADASVKKLALHGQELRIGWGKASHVPPAIAQAVLQHQATRNVFVGNIPEEMDEKYLKDLLGGYGMIDQVKIVKDKNIGFIHFLTIATAMKVVAQLPSVPGWHDRRVNYGKDRCAYVPKAQQAAVQAAQAQAAAAIASQHAQMPNSPFVPFSPMTPAFNGFGAPQTAFASPLFAGNGFPSANYNNNNDPAAQAGNRNVYLGNLHPDTTTEELCNHIRGGPVVQIRHLRDKNIAFVTFADSATALAFYTQVNLSGLTINARRLKVGWGKHSGPLSQAQAQAIQSGASRNVYIGQITDFEKITEEKLREDFGQYGDIEMINFLKDKAAAFVNFTNITSAQKALDGIKGNSDYEDLRISYGKDRCANMPRATNGGDKILTPVSAQRLSPQGDDLNRSSPTDGESPIQPAPPCSVIEGNFHGTREETLASDMVEEAMSYE